MMISIQTLARLIFIATAFALPSSQMPTTENGDIPTNPSKVTRLRQHPLVNWGPQSFLGWRMPARTRRTEIDNAISTFSPAPTYPRNISPEASALGESIMEEFVMFLTLKDAGVLDYCLQLK